MWDSESESVGGRDYNNGVVASSKQGVKTDGFEQRGQSWHVATDIPSDFLIQIGDASFHLHKYPLLSRSGKMNRVIYESRNADLDKVVIDDLPGGPEAFELAAKFCYGIAVDLTATNISGLRCAAEYLEMTEDLEEGNLIFKTEAFLSYVVLSSWRDSILVLKSCEKLSPWAENLQIVRRCSESIAWKACANPKGIRWAYTGKPPKVSSPKWNGMKDSSPSRNQQVPPDWWFEDVSILRIDHFVRVITAIKVKGMRFELIGAAIMHYAAKWLPGLIKEGTGTGDEGSNSSNSNGSSSSWKGELHMILAGTRDEMPTVQAKDQRMIIESLISISPPQKDSVSCSFLLRLLRMANMLKVAPALVTELEKRVGMQFEQATLPDLLIPSYNKNETLYDVDLVQRLLEHFLVQEQTEISSPSRQSFSDKHIYEGTQRGNVPSAKMRVARLVDSYLTEVSRDRNLSLTKFQVLAEALPESARICDDGLYRAIDSYLKAHPTLSEHERKRLCRVMDCQKLSIDACMHAAQNERLPLRVVVQVLFSEQVKISNAMANISLKEAGESQYQPLMSNRKSLLEGTPQSFQEGWAAAKKDINTLKFELETVKAKYLELQNDMDNLQRQFDKLSKPKQTSSWTSGWKKLSKFTQKTNSQAPPTRRLSTSAMRRASSTVLSHLSPSTKISFSLLSRDFITHLSSVSTTTTNEYNHHHPSQTHLKTCGKSSALLLSKIKSHQFQTPPCHFLNTLVDRQPPPPMSSRQRKIKERSELEEAFESAKTAEDMLKAFKDMEASFDETELGLASLKLGLKLDQEGEDPEKTLSFANRAFKALDRDDKTVSLPLAMALQLLGSACYSLKRFNDSLGYLNRAGRILNRLEKEGSCSVEDIRPILHAVQLELANTKTAMGRREEALGNLKNCLEIKEMTLEKNSRELGNANRDLAEAYAAVLNFKEALPFCLKALEIHKAQLGHNSVEVAHDRRLLGVIYTGLEEHEKALEQNQLSQKVLKNWGLSSDLLRAGIDAANIQIALGKYEEAINTLKDVVQQTDKQSEDRAMVFISMGKALCNQEKFADSKRCLEIACGILDKKEETSPVEVAEAYMEISMQYESMNEFETAITLLKRTQAMLEKLPQEQHSEGSVSARIGWLLLLTGKVQQAIPYLESAAERLKECFGSKHFGVGYIYNNLGAAYLELDRPQSAAQMFAVAKEIMDVSLGPGHADTVEACQNLSKAYGAMGSYPLAIKFQEEVIDAWEGHGPSAQDELKEAQRLLEQLKKKARGASSSESPVRALPLPHNSQVSTRSSQPGVSISEKRSSAI